MLASPPPVVLAVVCAPPTPRSSTAHPPKAPSLDAAAIEHLEHLGPTLVDKGVNFGVYCERAERIEVLLFDDPESHRCPPASSRWTRFGDVWNVYVEGVGVGQHYGYVAWGPNWPYDPELVPRARSPASTPTSTPTATASTPTSCSSTPTARRFHRDHDWSKGIARQRPRPRRARPTPRRRRAWSCRASTSGATNETAWRARAPGPRLRRPPLERPHPLRGAPQGLHREHRPRASQHPGTFRGFGEKADYLADLGVTAVELLPLFEKPLDGGYWGYNTLGFFAPENTYALAQTEHERGHRRVQVDGGPAPPARHRGHPRRRLQPHRRGRLLAHEDRAGPGDPSINPELVNFDPKEVASLYSFRGLDNAAYYALSPGQGSSTANNTGVGNETRANHTPMRRLIIDSPALLGRGDARRRLPLRPGAGAGRDATSTTRPGGTPKNTVLQDIVDDPVLPEAQHPHHRRALGAGAVPRSAASRRRRRRPGLRLGRVERQLPRLVARVRELRRPSTLNSDRGAVDGGARSPARTRCYGVERPQALPLGELRHRARRLHHVRPVLVRPEAQRLRPAQPGLLHRTRPTPSARRTRGEDNNRSRNWGRTTRRIKRQLMRDLFVAMMITHGTPMLYGGDEWMRTQLGNNNAYSHAAPTTPYNWYDWGTWQAKDEAAPHARLRQAGDSPPQGSRLRLRAARLRRTARPSPGRALRTTTTVELGQQGPDDALLRPPPRARSWPCSSTARPTTPPSRCPRGATWKRLLDTQQYFDLPDTLTARASRRASSNNVWLDAPDSVPGATYTAKARDHRRAAGPVDRGVAPLDRLRQARQWQDTPWGAVWRR